MRDLWLPQDFYLHTDLKYFAPQQIDTIYESYTGSLLFLDIVTR